MILNQRRHILALILVTFVCLLGPAMLIHAQEDVTISLIYPEAPVAVDEPFTIIVQVNAGTQSVDGAAAYLNFDPTVLQIIQIIPSSALPISLQQQIDNANGTIDLAFGQIGGGFPTGTFTLATMTARALVVTGDATLTFQSSSLRRTDVTFDGASVFGGSGDLHFAVLDATLEPTATTTPFPTVELPTLEAPPTIAPTASLPAIANMDGGAPDWQAFGDWQLEAQDYLGRAGLGWRLASTSNGMATLQWTRWLDLTGVAGAELTFLSQLTGANGNGIVQVTVDGSGWSTVALVPTTSSLTSIAVDLAAYVGHPVQFRYVWGPLSTASGESGYWLLDDVVVVATAPDSVLPTSTEIVPTVEITIAAPTEVLPTAAVPTEVPPTEVPTELPTAVPPTEAPTEIPPAAPQTDVPVIPVTEAVS